MARIRAQAPEGFLSVQDFARLHNVSPALVHQWIHLGRLQNYFYKDLRNRYWVKATAPPSLSKKRSSIRKVLTALVSTPLPLEA